MNTLEMILVAVAVLSGGGFLWAYAGWQKSRSSLVAAEERLALMQESRETLTDLLKAQAAASAETVAERLVSRATETFRAEGRVSQTRIEAQLKPVADTLRKFEAQVAQLEQVRARDMGGLKSELAALMSASSATRDEARKLTEALRGNTGRRGRWGEQTCRNVLEAAGMAGRFDFEEQTSTADDAGRQQRPDFIVRLPGGGMFVIDAKVPLAFADEGEGDEEQRQHAASVRTAASMKTHVRQLASKAYQDQFQPSPDFVAMFVPGDAFLSAALDHEPDLMTQAMASRVVIVTPTTLFALCKAVAYGWRAEEQTRNAEDVARLGKELYKRLSVMGGHAASVGKALDAAVGRYNQFVGSLESQVMVSARRFEDLKVDHEGKDLPDLSPVESAPRTLSRPELLKSPETGASKG